MNCRRTDVLCCVLSAALAAVVAPSLASAVPAEGSQAVKDLDAVSAIGLKAYERKSYVEARTVLDLGLQKVQSEGVTDGPDLARALALRAAVGHAIDGDQAALLEGFRRALAADPMLKLPKQIKAKAVTAAFATVVGELQDKQGTIEHLPPLALHCGQSAVFEAIVSLPRTGVVTLHWAQGDAQQEAAMTVQDGIARAAVTPRDGSAEPIRYHIAITNKAGVTIAGFADPAQPSRIAVKCGAASPPAPVPAPAPVSMAAPAPSAPAEPRATPTPVAALEPASAVKVDVPRKSPANDDQQLRTAKIATGVLIPVGVGAMIASAALFGTATDITQTPGCATANEFCQVALHASTAKFVAGGVLGVTGAALLGTGAVFATKIAHHKSLRSSDPLARNKARADVTAPARVLVVVGILTGLGGVGLATAGSVMYSRADRRDDTFGAAERVQHAGLAMIPLGLGTAAVAAGLVHGRNREFGEPASSVQVAPVVLRGGGGVTVGMRF